MAEYIEREAAIKEFSNNGSIFVYGERQCKAIVSRLNAISSADVVPVVRCKECKYNLANIPDIQDGMNINENWNACQLTELYDSVEPMDFCSRGAKMDGGGQDG